MSSLETCIYCGHPTGRAGRAEDSIYCDRCDTGPFCRECFDEHEAECQQDNSQFGVGA